jgi:hypothetical protein
MKRRSSRTQQSAREIAPDRRFSPDTCEATGHRTGFVVLDDRDRWVCPGHFEYSGSKALRDWERKNEKL